MILSKDHKSLFLSVPKTGSTTMRELLKPYGIPLMSMIGVGPHATKQMVDEVYPTLYPESEVRPEDMTVYLFWRDPIDRFMSGVSFSLQYKNALKRLFPEEFHEMSEHMTDEYKNLPDKFTESMLETLPLKTREKIMSLVYDENMVFRALECVDNLVFTPQWHWYTGSGNIVTLNFHDFENEARRLLTVFGADPSLEIPKKNKKPDFIPKLNITEHYQSVVLDRYLGDIALDPRLLLRENAA